MPLLQICPACFVAYTTDFLHVLPGPACLPLSLAARAEGSEVGPPALLNELAANSASLDLRFSSAVQHQDLQRREILEALGARPKKNIMTKRACCVKNCSSNPSGPTHAFERVLEVPKLEKGTPNDARAGSAASLGVGFAFSRFLGCPRT